MSPNGDMGTPEAAAELLAGQHDRSSAQAEPGVKGASLQMIGGRVLVPTLVFKAVYDPGWNQAGVYLCRNSDDVSFETISVDQLTAMIGIDVLPGIPAAVKMRVTALPFPAPHHAGGRGRQTEPPALAGMARSLLEDIRR